jgi:IS4 transposase
MAGNDSVMYIWFSAGAVVQRFVRGRRTKKKWLALLTTDTELPDEEVVGIYGKRWNIEVFFKMTKAYRQLREQARSLFVSRQ